MRLSFSSITLLAALAGIVCTQSGFGQGSEARISTMKGLPPRATPAEYAGRAQAGTVMIGAEFDAHSVPTAQSIYSTEDYVAVEVALYGPADARIKLSYEDFSLRIDGKKSTTPAQPYETIFKSLKDPAWIPPVSPESKSKGGLNTGGGAEGDSLPVVVHMPAPMQRVMEQNVQNAALPEGERSLPQAGLLFFRRGGKTTGIRTLELVYEGPAGKASIPLQP
jgi:hypothetical protein